MSSKIFTSSSIWPIRLKRLLIAFLGTCIGIFVLYGCGSSGGGGGQPSHSDVVNGGTSQTDVVNGGTSQTGGTPKSFNFYTGSIWLVNPDNPSDPIEIDSGATTGESAIYHGTWDATNRKLTDYHRRTVVYGKDGKFYKISALKSDSLPSPIQVSNETTAVDICYNSVESDFNNHNNSVYIYELPGADHNCSSDTDNIWKMIRVGMSASDSPIPAKEVLETLKDDKLAIVGFLAIDPVNDGENIITDITHCDQNFANCVPVISHITRAVVLGNALDSVILQVDDNLYSYNVSTRTLSLPLYTLQGILYAYGSDETNFYFSEEKKLWKLPFNGGSVPFNLSVESGNITDLILTDDSVIYEVSNSADTLKIINKSDGGPAIIIPETTDPLSILSEESGWIYYQKGPNAGIVKEDGSGMNEVENAYWVGTISSSNMGIWRVIRAEGCSSPPAYSCAGGTLKSFDAATASGEVILGTIPDDIDDIFIYGIGDDALGIGFNAEMKLDIFYLKGDQAGSLKRVTTTPAISEFPIF